MDRCCGTVADAGPVGKRRPSSTGLSCRAARTAAVRRWRCRATPAASAAQLVGSGPFDTITTDRGFLPSTDPCRRLAVPGSEEWEAALHDIPKLVVASSGSGQVLRRSLAALPPFPTASIVHQGSGAEGGLGGAGGALAVDGGQAWRAYLLLSFIAHAYMWCEEGPTPQVLPARLAVPWAAVSRALDMPPVLVYATYNLYNWRRLPVQAGAAHGGTEGHGDTGSASGGGPGGPVALNNIVCLHNFFGGQDEEWFRLVHVDIEAKAAAAVANIPRLQQAVQQGDAPEVLRGLALMQAALQAMQQVLSRMGEKCDPYIYYKRVRQPMSGWRGNPALPQGLVYEGVSPLPVQLYGETGAQSSIVPALDAALGIRHEEGWLRDYLDDMQGHMPPAHRAFIDGARPGGTALRAMCAAAPAGVLRDQYNMVVSELEKFRAQHKAFAFNYIAKFSKQEAQLKGTGGSDFMPALGGYRDTTSKHFI